MSTRNSVEIRSVDGGGDFGAVIKITDHALDRFMTRITKDRVFREHSDVAKKYMEMSVGKSIMSVASSLGAEAMRKPFRIHADGVTYIAFLSEDRSTRQPCWVVKTCYSKSKSERRTKKQHIKGRARKTRVNPFAAEME